MYPYIAPVSPLNYRSNDSYNYFFGNSRFLLLVELINQRICELEVSFLHLWSQSICDLVAEGISWENKLFANIVVRLNKKIWDLNVSRKINKTSCFDVFLLKRLFIEQNFWSSRFLLCSLKWSKWNKSRRS